MCEIPLKERYAGVLASKFMMIRYANKKGYKSIARDGD